MTRTGRRGTAIIVIATSIVAACTAQERSSGDAARRATASSSGSGDALALADSAYFRGEYDSARAMYDGVVLQAGGSRDSLRLAQALTGIGWTHWKQGDLDSAKSIGERALALKQRLGVQREIAKSLNALGLLAQERGQLDEAFRRFVDARAAAEAAHDSGYIARARGNLGMVYQDLGDFDRARDEMMAFRDAAAAIRDERLLGNALNNLGMLETHVANPDSAIELLAAARRHYATSNYAVGLENSLGQLSIAFSQRGEISKALAYLDSAFTIATKHGLDESRADDLELMAELYENGGDHRRALDFLRRARALDDSMRTTTKLGHVALAEAVAYKGLGNQSLARNRAREAAALQRSAGARMDELDALLFQAELSRRAGDAADAASALAAADSLVKQLGWAVARIRFALGAARVADIAHRPLDVLTLLDSTKINRLLLSADEQAEMEALRARSYFRLRQYAMAVTSGRRAVAGFERIRGGIGAGSLRASYLADRATAYSDLVLALLALGQVDEAFRVAEEARGRALLEHLRTAAREQTRQASPGDSAAMASLLRRIDELVERLRIRDTLGTRNPNRSAGTSDGAIARELLDARRQYEALLDRVPGPDPGAGNLRYGAVDVRAIRQGLAADEALLEYLSTPEKLVVFVTTRSELRWLEAPIGSAELMERVHLARELIGARSDAVDGPLRDLYDKIIAPAKGSGLLAGIRSLVIVPHGALTYLPFAALRAPSTGRTSRYLIEDYSIATISSASALPILRHRPAVTADQGATAFAPFPQTLPSSTGEADAVGRQLARARVVVGASATEPALRDALLQSRIVHVATHGVLNPDSPMFSGIEVAATADATDRRPDNDGRLETYEVLSMNVRSWLVFLSGCETALGYSWSSTYSRRDDYATLAQAFLFAGARNVVATLWRIDDRGAAEFAQRFYAAIGASSPSLALAAAQRAFTADPRYSAPYYWAGYVLSGSGDGSP